MTRLRWPWVRRTQAETQQQRAERFLQERDNARTERQTFRTAAIAASRLYTAADRELGLYQEIVATHVHAAGHPSTVLHDVHTFADALVQALTDAGVDIRGELNRLEGTDL